MSIARPYSRAPCDKPDIGIAWQRLLIFGLIFAGISAAAAFLNVARPASAG